MPGAARTGAVHAPETLTQTGWSAVQTPGASLRFLDEYAIPGLTASAVELRVREPHGGAWPPGPQGTYDFGRTSPF
jgi:hypothetical protein